MIMRMTTRIAVAGCTGYAGGEILRLLSVRDDIEIGALTAKSSAGSRLGEHQPHLSSLAEKVVADTTVENLAGHDVVFLALPHGASAEVAAQLDADVLVVDAGADFRLSSADDWQQFYGTPHAGTWPYGLPELPGQRAVLAGTKRIAVPGCFPTTVTLALAPAIVAGHTDAHDTVVVSPTGPSGAGKALKPHLLGAELMGSASAYGVGGGHRHTPEMLQNFRLLGADNPTLSFTPVLVPMSRGILATVTAPLCGSASAGDVRAAYTDFYADEPFVHLLPQGQWPMTQSVLGSNHVQVQVTVDEAAGRIVAVAALDNLTKGTAGGAVQSMNIALGLPETRGLTAWGVAP